MNINDMISLNLYSNRYSLHFDKSSNMKKIVVEKFFIAILSFVSVQ